MFMVGFWAENAQEIIISSLVALLAIALLTYLTIVQTREKKTINSIAIGIAIVVVVVLGVTYSLFKDGIAILKIVIFDFLIVLAYTVISLVLLDSQSKNKKKQMTTKKVAFLGIMIGLMSVLMLFGIPIFPGYSFLKVEFSGLILLLILLWFDFKAAIIASLLTNIIHALMPSSTAPLIPFLDEGVNFIASMSFILPSAILLKYRKDATKPSDGKILLAAIIGVVFTTVFMVLYNYFINLPIIYKWPLPFNTVFYVFGFFNIVKWGLVALGVVLMWSRLYKLKFLIEAK